jgi:hypothetical protein
MSCIDDQRRYRNFAAAGGQLRLLRLQTPRDSSKLNVALLALVAFVAFVASVASVSIVVTPTVHRNVDTQHATQHTISIQHDLT